MALQALHWFAIQSCLRLLLTRPKSGRGLMKHFKTGQELAQDMGVSADKLADTFDKYNEIAKNGGDPFGKKVRDCVVLPELIS